jgi:hypothetical protein
MAALNGDYISRTITFTFSAGETSVGIFVSTLIDTVAELTERFEAELRNPSGGVVVGAQNRATVDILDLNGEALLRSVNAGLTCPICSLDGAV